MPNILVTALRESPHKGGDRAVPKVVSIDTTKVVKVLQVVNAVTGSQNTLVKVKAPRYEKTYMLAETYGQYLLQTDYNNAASSPFNTGTKANVAASGAGAAASAQAITAYFNAVTAATVSTMTGIKLPNASAAGKLGQPIVVLNSASTSVIVFPAASEFLNSSTAGAVTIAPGRVKHFYNPTTAAWVECRGPAW